MKPLLLNVADAAAALGVTVSYLKRGAAAYAIPHTRIGRAVKFSQANLDAIVAMGEVRPITPLRQRRSA